jgi:hypothetical protein
LAGDRRAAATAEAQLVREVRQPPELFELARLSAQLAAAAERDTGLSADEQASLAAKHAAQALALLQGAAQSGYFRDPRQARALREDPLLAPVRDRREYRALLSDVPASK